MITGELFVGNARVDPGRGYVRALDPYRNVEIEPPFALAGLEEVDKAANLADDAFDTYSRTGLVINAFAQPQEVEHSTIHGGPFPATTDSRFTSVGMSSIDRFLRPVTYQNFPSELLPPPLRDTNDLGLWRLVDGEFTQE